MAERIWKECAIALLPIETTASGRENMAARIEEDWTIVLPRGDSKSFSVRNCGGRHLDREDGAELVVQALDGTIALRRIARAQDNVFRFRIAPQDTQEMAEGAYLYDIRVITGADFSDPQRLQPRADSDVYSVFAPRLRKFLLGRAAGV